MIIKVTKKDINCAIRNMYNETSCPIALAMKRHGLNNPKVNPEDDYLSYSSNGDEEAGWTNRVMLKIPRSVARFVKAFDSKYDSSLPRWERRMAKKTMIRPFSFLVRKER